MRLGEYDRAETDYRRALVLTPADSGLYALLAEACAGKADYAGAVIAARRALGLARAEGDERGVEVYAGLLEGYAARAAAAKSAPPVKSAPKSAPKPKSKPEPEADLPPETPPSGQ
jgi:tetratricopeptide (TPR) repeat protein